MTASSLAEQPQALVYILLKSVLPAIDIFWDFKIRCFLSELNNTFVRILKYSIYIK